MISRVPYKYCHRGLEFYPDSAKLTYKKAGFYLLNDDKINARISLVDALKNHLDKLHFFQKEFPQFSETEWVRAIVAIARKASK